MAAEFQTTLHLGDIDGVNFARLSLQELKAQGVKIIAPPTFALLAVSSAGEVGRPAASRAARNAG